VPLALAARKHRPLAHDLQFLASMEGTTKSTTSPNLGTDALFTQYIDVVNRVLGENRSGLYACAVQVWHKTIGDEPIAVGVYSGDAAHPHHWYTVKLTAGTFDLLERSKSDDAKFSWKVDESHLSHVVDNPQSYVEHPMTLDLDWLAARMGLA
jgi:hypothetical protein